MHVIFQYTKVKNIILNLKQARNDSLCQQDDGREEWLNGDWH